MTLMDWAVRILMWSFFGSYVGMLVWLGIKMLREMKEEREEE